MRVISMLGAVMIRPFIRRARRFVGPGLLLAALPSASALELESCFLDRLRSPARCGELAVPLAHGAPEQGTITLGVAVLPALDEPARPDPVVVLAGGPGQSAVSLAATVDASLAELNRERDIVLVDQRGTGRSTPLTCEIDFDALAFDAAAKAAAIERCLEAFPADPRHFTTRAHVEDLEAVRRALGYERVNLYGGSYGTRVELVYLREHPEAIRTAVLDAVAPMDLRIGLEMGADAQGAYERLFADCAEDPACAAAFPDLRGTVEGLLAALEAAPQTVRYPDPASGEPLEETVDHRIMALAIRSLLYSPRTRRALPVALHAAATGRFVPLLGLATAANADLRDQITPGLLLAVLCAEDLAGITAEDIPARERESFVGTAQVDEFLAYCRAWPAPVVAMDWTAPESAVPTLLLSGALDPVTPPARAAAAAATLPASRHVIVPAGGHTVAGHPCVADLIATFVATADPDAPDATCVDDIEAPTFFTSLLGPATGATGE